MNDMVTLCKMHIAKSVRLINGNLTLFRFCPISGYSTDHCPLSIHALLHKAQPASDLVLVVL